MKAEFLKKNIFIVSIFFILIITRFIWLDKFPPGMQYDEAEYALSSKTFQLMGKDISGTSFPQSLITTNTLGKVSPIPYMILSPLWFFVDLNMQTFRIIYVFINIITAFVLMGIVREIFNKNKLTIITGLIFLMNPWSFFLSRHAIDGAIVLLFFLLGVYFLLKKYSHKNIFIAGVFFMLGFFSYHGAKLQLIPLIAIITIHNWYVSPRKKIIIKPYLILNVVFLAALGIFLLAGKFTEGSILKNRYHEIVFTNMESFSDEVVKMRTASIETPMHSLVINKVYFAARYLTENYLQSFSPFSLFYSAEIMKYSGFFYLIDAIFIMIGIFALFINKRSIFFLLLGLLSIAPLSSAISMSGFSILNRGILLLPVFTILISFGIYYLLKFAKEEIFKKIILFAITIPYFFSFLIFLYTYFFILPIELFGHYQVSNRALAKFISLEFSKKEKIVISTKNPRVMFAFLTFYNLNSAELEEFVKQNIINGNTYKLKNILITDKCPDNFIKNTLYVINKDVEKCEKKQSKFDKIIANKIDAGINFKIFNGETCSNFSLKPWIAPHFINDFSIEKMSEKKFCERWITSNYQFE